VSTAERDMTNRWPGHAPTTSKLLLKVLLRAQSGDEGFSYAERVLFTACEFWAAAKTRNLHAHLGLDANHRLRVAEEAFAVVGLVSIPTILRLERIHLCDQASPASLRGMAIRIEDALGRDEESVDVKLCEFACDQSRDRLPAPMHQVM